MKKLLYIIVLFVFVLTSCNNLGKKKTEKTQNENRTQTEEEIIEANNENTENTEESYYDGFIIRSKEVDFIEIGKPLPNPVPDFISYQFYEKSVEEEGEEYIYSYFAITENKNEVIKAKLEENKVVEILILKNVAQTEEGVGIGTKLEIMCGFFPEIKIYYTYVSDRFFAETPEYPDVQFIVSGDSYLYSKTDLTNTDLQEVYPQDFSETAEITQIRLF